MQISSDSQFQYTYNHIQFDMCCHVMIWFYSSVSHYSVTHVTTNSHQAVVAEWLRAMDFLSVSAGRWFESRWRHIFSF